MTACDGFDFISFPLGRERSSELHWASSFLPPGTSSRGWRMTLAPRGGGSCRRGLDPGAPQELHSPASRPPSPCPVLCPCKPQGSTSCPTSGQHHCPWTSHSAWPGSRICLCVSRVCVHMCARVCTCVCCRHTAGSAGVCISVHVYFLHVHGAVGAACMCVCTCACICVQTGPVSGPAEPGPSLPHGASRWRSVPRALTELNNCSAD